MLMPLVAGSTAALQTFIVKAPAKTIFRILEVELIGAQ
jgi:hypothetical protein